MVEVREDSLLKSPFASASAATYEIAFAVYRRDHLRVASFVDSSVNGEFIALCSAMSVEIHVAPRDRALGTQRTALASGPVGWAEHDDLALARATFRVGKTGWQKKLSLSRRTGSFVRCGS